MGYPKRIHYQGCIYHVMLRGNHGQSIFFNDSHRIKLLSFIKESSEKYNVTLYAYCLMNNHIHLATKVNNEPVSEFVKHFASRYSKWLNWKLERKGHLFQNRFRSIIVEKDNYLVRLIRYIHLNPVRAKLTTSPENYHWSSFHEYSKNSFQAYCNIEFILKMFHPDVDKAIKKFINFNSEIENDNSIFKTGINNTQILGSKNFLKKLGCCPFEFKDAIAYIDKIYQKHSLTCRKEIAITYLANKFLNMSITEISHQISINQSTAYKSLLKISLNDKLVLDKFIIQE